VTCYKTDPVFPSGKTPHNNKTANVLTTAKIWSLVPEGLDAKTDWLTEMNNMDEPCTVGREKKSVLSNPELKLRQFSVEFERWARILPVHHITVRPPETAYRFHILNSSKISSVILKTISSTDKISCIRQMQEK